MLGGKFAVRSASQSAQAVGLRWPSGIGGEVGGGARTPKGKLGRTLIDPIGRLPPQLIAQALPWTNLFDLVCVDVPTVVLAPLAALSWRCPVLLAGLGHQAIKIDAAKTKSETQWRLRQRWLRRQWVICLCGALVISDLVMGLLAVVVAVSWLAKRLFHRLGTFTAGKRFRHAPFCPHVRTEAHTVARWHDHTLARSGSEQLVSVRRSQDSGQRLELGHN
jgi:hypothetical protein